MKKSEALKILGLTDGAGADEIKKAHRKLIIENHPDKFGQDAEKRAAAEEKTKLINEARDVLENHSWEPEYSTRGTQYGAPYTYNPYAGASGAGRPTGNGGGYSTDPFAGWPFGAGDFVWTTWDAEGNRTTYTNAGQTHSADYDPFTYNPFAGMGFDFADLFGVKQKTKEELIAEAKQALQQDFGFIVGKLLILALCLALGATATGLYLYTIISIGQGIWKRLGILSTMFLLPFVLLAIIFTPTANSAIGFFGLFCFVAAVVFDISNVATHTKTLQQLKKS